MPTYEYVCTSCDHEFELFQQMSDSVRRKCPECGLLKLQRRIGTGAGVIFKGSGFFQTDYRSDSYRKAADAEKTDGKKDEKKDEKSDAKKDAKKDAAAKTDAKKKPKDDG